MSISAFATTHEGGESPESGPTSTRDRGAVPTWVAGRYEVGESLGRGGMGEVFAARDARTGERVALKVLRRGDAASKSVERLLREAMAAGRVDHPGVVRVFEAGEDASLGLAFIAQELLVGETLRARIQRRGGLPSAEAVALLAPVVDALVAAHAAGVVHRDLKPENIFVEGAEDEPRPKVIDFGIARLMTSEDLAGTQLTATGSVLGTPAYMSPEQARGVGDVDEQTDVWAVGVVLFELLTGQNPFARSTPHATLAAILLDPVPSPREIAPEVPEPIAGVVLRSLARNRVERFGAMSELAEALRDASRPWTTAASPPPAPRPRRRVVAGMLAAVAVGAAAALGIRLSSAPRAPVVASTVARAHAVPPPVAVVALVPPSATAPAPSVAPPAPPVAPRLPPAVEARRGAVRAVRPTTPADVPLPAPRRTNGAPILGL